MIGYYHGGYVYKGREHKNHDDAIVARILGNKVYRGKKNCSYGYNNLIGYIQSGEIYDRSGSLIGRYSGGIVYGKWNLNSVDTVKSEYSKKIGSYDEGDEGAGACGEEDT